MERGNVALLEGRKGRMEQREGWRESLNASLHNSTISHPEMVPRAMHTGVFICYFYVPIASLAYLPTLSLCQEI